MLFKLKKKCKWAGQKTLAIKYTVNSINHFEGQFLSIKHAFVKALFGDMWSSSRDQTSLCKQVLCYLPLCFLIHPFCAHIISYLTLSLPQLGDGFLP